MVKYIGLTTSKLHIKFSKIKSFLPYMTRQRTDILFLKAVVRHSSQQRVEVVAEGRGRKNGAGFNKKFHPRDQWRWLWTTFNSPKGDRPNQRTANSTQGQVIFIDNFRFIQSQKHALLCTPSSAIHCQQIMENFTINQFYATEKYQLHSVSKHMFVTNIHLRRA